MSVDFRAAYAKVAWDLASRRFSVDLWGKKNDTGRGIEVTILQNGVVFIPTTETLRMSFKKPDGTDGYISGVLSNGKYYIENMSQVFAVVGQVYADLEFTNSTEFIRSLTFVITVYDSQESSTIISSNDYTSLQEALQNVAHLESNYVPRLSDVESQLADRATRTELQSVASGSPKGVYATLANLQTAYPTGNTNIYVITADGKWYYWSGSAWTAGGTYQSQGIVNGSITEEKTSFLEKVIGKNLFNPTNPNVIVNQQIYADGSFIVSADRIVTGYIPVDEGKELKGSYFDGTIRKSDYIFNTTAVFDENLNIIPAQGNNSPGMYYRNNVTAGKKYVRFTIKNLYGTNVQIEQTTINGLVTSYESYWEKWYVQYAKEIVDSALISKYWFYNKVLSTMGDSITQQGLWQPHLVAKLGFSSFLNNGVGGTKIIDSNGSDTTAMCRDERINAISASSDVVLVMGGTNDWVQSASLGTITDTVTNTFYGALKTMCKKLRTRFPDKLICLLTTPYGAYPNYPGWTDTTGLKNNHGLTAGDYGDAVIKVGKLYGIPVIDVYGNAGWNIDNIATYVSNDGAYLHPNAEGAKRLASVVIGGLKRVEPIV